MRQNQQIRMQGVWSGLLASLTTLGVTMMMMALLAAATACGSPPALEAPVQDSFWSGVRTSKQATEVVEVPKVSGGTLQRSEVLDFLENGPATLLRSVPVTPVLEGDALVGYQIDDFFVNDSRFERIDLQRGDIVTAVNQDRLLRPEDLFAVWESLRAAPRLQIDVIRENTLRTLTWEIVDKKDPVAYSP